jgi:GT2 family glycosyltransferase
MHHISIIIVHYNTPKDTKECVESLLKIETKNFDYNIIVVDNASKDLYSIPKSFPQHKIELIRSEANLGFTGGNNLGISHATRKYNSDYYLLINSDTYVEPNFLLKLYQKMLANPQAGMASPKIYFAKNYEFHKKSYPRHQKGKILWYAGGSIDWLNILAFHRGIDELDRGHFDSQKTSDFATGCCVLVKRDIIERVGIFDKKYFLYFEDVDWSIRAIKKGFEILFVAQSVIWHKNAGSSDGSGSNIHIYYQNRNRYLFALKSASTRAKITIFKLLLRKLFKGNIVEKQAAFDFILGRFGKQTII